VGHVGDEVQLQVRRDFGHQAPVQDAQPPVGGTQQIARVGVAVPVLGGVDADTSS